MCCTNLYAVRDVKTQMCIDIGWVNMRWGTNNRIKVENKTLNVANGTQDCKSTFPIPLCGSMSEGRDFVLTTTGPICHFLCRSRPPKTCRNDGLVRTWFRLGRTRIAVCMTGFAYVIKCGSQKPESDNIERNLMSQVEKRYFKAVFEKTDFAVPKNSVCLLIGCPPLHPASSTSTK